jgi:hypothetical protein
MDPFLQGAGDVGGDCGVAGEGKVYRGVGEGWGGERVERQLPLIVEGDKGDGGESPGTALQSGGRGAYLLSAF